VRPHCHGQVVEGPVASPVAELVERELLQSIAEDKVKTLAGHTSYVMSVCEVGGVISNSER